MFLKPALLSTVAALCLLLCACGRSSGGSAGGVEATTGSPELLISTSAVSQKATITQATGPSATISLTPRDAPSGAYIGYAYSTNGVATIAGNQPGRAPSALIITFQPPYQLRPGTYTDSLQIELCADSECVQPLTQRQFVTLTYVVGAAPAGQTPGVMLSTGSVNAQQFLTSMPIGFPKAPAVAVTFTNVPVAPQVSTSTTHDGVDTAIYNATPAAIGGNLSVYLLQPQKLGAGVYHDTVTVNACLDSNCENPLPAVSLSVTYTVTNMVGGSNGYTINAWPITATDISSGSVLSNGECVVSSPKPEVSNFTLSLPEWAIAACKIFCASCALPSDSFWL